MYTNHSVVQSFEEDSTKPIKEKPICVYYGHRADVLDLTWSKVLNGVQLFFVMYVCSHVHSLFVFNCRISSCFLHPWIKLCDCGISPGRNAYVAFSILSL